MNDLATVGLILLAAAIILIFVLWVRRPEPVYLEHSLTKPLDTFLTTVEHEGAVEGWSPAADVIPTGDPFARPLSEIELHDALLFDEIAATYPVRLDWQPPGFDQDWSTLGTVLAEMGETQPIPRIEVGA